MRHNIHVIKLFISLLCLVSFAWSVTNTLVRIEGISSERQVIMVDVGGIDGIKKNELGLLFFKTLKNDWQRTPVARICCVAVKDDRSFWRIQNLFDARPINLGETLYLENISKINRGRIEKQVSARAIWNAQGDVDDWEKEYLQGKSLQKRGQGYVEEQKIAEVEVSEYINSHVELPNLEQMPLDQVIPSEQENEGLKKLFSKQLAEETFEKTVAQHIKDINRADFTPEKREKSMEKSGRSMGTFNKVDDLENRFDIFQGRKDRFVEYVDDQLKTVSVDSSGEREQNWGKYYQPNMSVDVGVGYALNNAAPDLSEQNVGAKSYNSEFQIGAEFFPFHRELDLRRISFHADLRYQVNTIDVAGISTENNLWDIGLGARWYIYNLPGVIQRPIIAVVSKVRIGQSRLLRPSLGDSEKFNSLAFPTIGLVFRYNFLSRYGVYLGLEYQDIALSVLKNDAIFPNDIAYRNSLAKIGVSYLF